jgi:hypothetical protein
MKGGCRLNINWKQRELTIAALIAFVVIAVGHYMNCSHGAIYRPCIEDVKMPWFVLGVIYVGLFFLLADKKEKR